MVSSWSSWCRLCGNEECISKIDPEVEEIIKILNSQIAPQQTKICIDCNSYLNDVHQFTQKSRLLQSMFIELESVDLLFEQLSDEYNYEKNINDIRNRFGLKQLIVDHQHEKNQEILESLFDDSALEIKMEKLESDMEHHLAPIVSEKNFQSADDESIGDGGNNDDGDDDEVEELDTSGDDISSDIEELNTFKVQTESDFDNDEMEENEQEHDEGGEYMLHTLDQKKRRSGGKAKRKADEEKLFDFVCHICRKEFDKMSELVGHCREAHKCLAQVQCFCGKTLGTWKRLLIHKQKHFPEKLNYECKECKMVYKMKASFLNHMKSKHGPDAKKFVCSKCARCFKDSRTLLAHEKTHLPNELKLIYPCDICQKKFVNKNSLKSHIVSVHEMSNLYTCERCGRSFSTKSNLKSHLYSHSNEKNVQCDICSARFKNMDSLRKHKKTHLEKSHECNICGNRYRNRNNLKAHLVCHSDVKAFRCSFCPNEYKRSKDLKCHMNLHTGERPYQCQFCSRTFVNGSNCRKHKLKDHPEELASFEAQFGRGKAAVFALQCHTQPPKSPTCSY